MRRIVSPLTAVALAIAGLALIAPTRATAAPGFNAAELKCVSAKQKAASKYCKAALKAWSKWDTTQDVTKRNASIGKAQTSLTASWGKAEAKSPECITQTLPAIALLGDLDAAVAAVVADVNGALDLNDSTQAKCGSKLLSAAASLCGGVVGADAKFVKDPLKTGNVAKRDASKDKASTKFGAAWAKSSVGCPTTATEQTASSLVAAAGSAVGYGTAVAQDLDGSQFATYSPTGTTDYDGLPLTPRCVFDDNPGTPGLDESAYHFFVKRGSVNKLVMYYQGGGACWDNTTCGVPVCDANVNPSGSDNPNNTTTGFGDLTNPDNPFKDWNIVFVSYCSCDIHYGDVSQDYAGLAVEHRGFQNAKIVEKFARENFLAPERVFVTGSSAGGYGALFNAVQLESVWPGAEFDVLGDASNGVITASFLQNEFNNWNFVANLPPEIPGVIDSITSGDGMPGYLKAVADYFPNTSWANYTTAYDGGTGGQTGFYNLMLTGSVAGAILWWQGSCAFNAQMDLQATDVYTDVSAVNDNYRYYIGTGSRHTMYGSNKVYSDQTGGEPQTIVDWINDMISYDPATSVSTDWENAHCTDCGWVLPGDPVPPAIPTAPFFAGGPTGTEIICP